MASPQINMQKGEANMASHHLCRDPAEQTLGELRIVLLGAGCAGKSSAGNTILGREVFGDIQGRQCKMEQGEVAGRRVAVVDTPGWWENFAVRDTADLIKQEVKRSVYLCHPGPHVFLLVVRIVHFTDKDRQEVQEHLELLGDRVWRHTIVLFTRGDWLRDKTIEQYIKEWEDLQWLVEKCGNRYHVLNNKNRGDGTQVTELLEKINGMLAENSGCHYKIDGDTLKVVEEKREIDAKVKQRKELQEQKKDLRELIKGGAHRLSELAVVLLGWREAGKSSAGNTILGREEFRVGRRTAECVVKLGDVAGRRVSVVDTPGWWPDHSVQKTPELLRKEIARSESLCPLVPQTLLLVIALDSSFTAEQRTAVEEHVNLLGPRVWGHTILLFTRRERLGDKTVEQHIERWKDLRLLVEKCESRYHIFNNKNRGDGTQVTELMEKIEEMVAGKSARHSEIKERIEKETYTREQLRKIVEEEVSKREKELFEKMMAMMTAMRGRRNSRDLLPPSLSGDAPSEPGSLVLVRACKKVEEWDTHESSTPSEYSVLSTRGDEGIEEDWDKVSVSDVGKEEPI